MLIGFISDTHMPRGARRLPDACVERLRGVDLILHAGDVMTAEALREMESIGPPLLAVHGNVDSAELRRLLPERQVVDAGGVRIGMVHDSGPRVGREARVRRRFPDADVVVFGHSHIPVDAPGTDGQWLLNPGSPTDRRRQPHHTIGILETEAGRLVDHRIVVVDG